MIWIAVVSVVSFGAGCASTILLALAFAEDER
jgi:hypothetical protein